MIDNRHTCSLKSSESATDPFTHSNGFLEASCTARSNRNRIRVWWRHLHRGSCYTFQSDSLSLFALTSPLSIIFIWARGRLLITLARLVVIIWRVIIIQVCFNHHIILVLFSNASANAPLCWRVAGSGSTGRCPRVGRGGGCRCARRAPVTWSRGEWVRPMTGASTARPVMGRQ